MNKLILTALIAINAINPIWANTQIYRYSEGLYRPAQIDYTRGSGTASVNVFDYTSGTISSGTLYADANDNLSGQVFNIDTGHLMDINIDNTGTINVIEF